MLERTVAAAEVASTYAPPATVLRQDVQFQMPTDFLLQWMKTARAGRGA